MNIVLVGASKLEGADYNPREIAANSLHDLASSLVEYGFVEPVVVNRKTNNIVGGHQRVKAIPQALELIKEKLLAAKYQSDEKYKELESREKELSKVPVCYVDVSEAQEKALNLALNKISGEWVVDKLAEVLKSLQDESLPTGFSEDEISEILAEYELKSQDEPLTDQDAVPELDEKNIISRRGDLWQLGKHLLCYGDSCKQSDIDKLMQGQYAAMCFTDPPYLMNYQGAMGKGGKKNQRHEVITNDNLSKAEGDKFLEDICFSIERNTAGAWYVCFYRLGIDRLFLAMDKAGMQWRNQVIWAKEHFTLSNSDYKSQYEP